MKKIKSNKGITGIDATIAVVILMIFIPLIASLFSNINNISNKAKRKSRAVNIAIQAIEGAKMLQYDDIVGDKIELNKIFGNSGNYTADNIPNGYSIDVNVAEQEEYKEVIINVNYKENLGIETVQLRTKIYQ